MCSVVKAAPLLGSPLRAFGSKLRALREHYGLSQLALAPYLALSNGHLNNLELGRREPSLETAARAALFFNVSIDYLLKDSYSAMPVPKSSRPPQAVASDHLLSAFPTILQDLRQREGISQVALARALGLSSQSVISNLEAGRRKPSIDLILQLTEKFTVSAHYLVLGIQKTEVFSIEQQQEE